MLPREVMSTSAGDVPFRLCDVMTPVLTFANAALGAGVLAYPFAYSGSGLAIGPCLTMSVGTLAFLSLCVIMRVAAAVQEEQPHIQSYGGIVQAVIGRRAGLGVEVLCLCYCFAGTISYTVLVGDQNPLLLKVLPTSFWPPDDDAATDKARLYLILCATLIGFCLNLLRRVSALRYSAVVLVVSVFFTVSLLLSQAILHPCRPNNCDDELEPPEGPRNGWPDRGKAGVSAWPTGFSGILRALPLFAFANQCHLQVGCVCKQQEGHLSCPQQLSIVVRSVCSSRGFKTYMTCSPCLRSVPTSSLRCRRTFATTLGAALSLQLPQSSSSSVFIYVLAFLVMFALGGGRRSSCADAMYFQFASFPSHRHRLRCR